MHGVFVIKQDLLLEHLHEKKWLGPMRGLHGNGCWKASFGRTVENLTKQKGEGRKADIVAKASPDFLQTLMRSGDWLDGPNTEQQVPHARCTSRSSPAFVCSFWIFQLES